MPNPKNNFESIAGSASEYFQRYAGPSLTEPQNRQLGTLVRAGDAAARGQMIQGNINLGLKFAAPFLRRWERDEVYSNALLGIIDAVEKYDPNKGVFSSYAKRKVQQFVLVAMASERATIRVPRNVAQKLARWRKKHGDSDTVMPPDLAAVAALETTVGLDAKIGEDGELTLAETIAAPESEFPPGEREEIEERLGPANAFVEELDAVGRRPESAARAAASNSCDGLNHNQERNTTMTNQTTKTIRAGSGCEEKQPRSSRSRNCEARFESSTMPQPQSKPGQQLEFDFPKFNTNNNARNYAN